MVEITRECDLESAIALLVILIAIVNLSVMIFYWGLAQIRPGSLANEFTK